MLESFFQNVTPHHWLIVFGLYERNLCFSLFKNSKIPRIHLLVMEESVLFSTSLVRIILSYTGVLCRWYDESTDRFIDV